MQLTKVCFLLCCVSFSLLANPFSCNFYPLLEEELNCSEIHPQATNYLLNYAHKYCRVFSLYSTQWQDERSEWVQKTRECLQDSLFDQRQELSCDNLESRAFASHSKCYTQAGFCELSLNSQKSISRVILNWDIFYRPIQILKEAGQVYYNCRKSY